MEILRCDTLAGIIQRCSDYSGYKAGVVFANRAQRNMFMDSMKEMNILGDELWRVDKRSMAAKFINGSVIKALVFDEPSKGQRLHEIIFDKEISREGIPDDVVYALYRPMLMPYRVNGDFVEEQSHVKEEKFTHKDPEQDLDNFLCSFAIT